MLWKEVFRTDSTDSISSWRMSWEYVLLVKWTHFLWSLLTRNIDKFSAGSNSMRTLEKSTRVTLIFRGRKERDTW